MKPIAFLIFALSTVAVAQWKPVDGGMLTKWAQKVDPLSAWTEYPRPQLKRADWTNLNGLWKYSITAMEAGEPADWAGEILVPFCPESALSGVGRAVEPDEALWYETPLPAPTGDKRTILHFEAVDYESTVWINGTRVGTHRGGHTPFSFDITSLLKPADNLLRVRVHDATEGFQLHGKQKLEPGGIWYTRVTGIWQTVWLERVPQRFIRDLVLACDIEKGTITVTPQLSGRSGIADTVRATIIDGERRISTSGRGELTLTIPDPDLWTPSNPRLYDLTVELLDDNGDPVDTVSSYTAIRSFGKTRDAGGNWRLTLNGGPLFHWGPLDQGWWPGGLLTPPSDEAMLSDIEYLKACGFNMIRKHIKIEPRRYYYHCDRLGMMVWQDQVSMGYGPQTEPIGSNPPWTRMRRDPADGHWPDDAHRQFILEYKRMVDHLRNSPCIAVWVPFNEAWGQHRTLEVGKLAAGYDRTRALNIASGGNFWAVGDIADHHAYPHPEFPLDDRRFDNFVKVVGEFGGHGWPVKGHLWKEDNANWGYGGLPKSLDEWKQRFSTSIDILCHLRKQGIAAGVYTQTSDVELEINGLLTYDRLRKVDSDWVRKQSERLLATPDVVDTTWLLPTARDNPRDWSYTTTEPQGGWEAARFPDSGWKSGPGGFGTPGTPRTQVHTVWDTRDIWIRTEFRVEGEPTGEPYLEIYHDEAAEVFLNGIRVASFKGFSGSYIRVPLEPSALSPGVNTLAIHCHQTEGGQYIDAGILVEKAR